MQEFLNENLKPYNTLTREEKHILLDASLDGNCEFSYDHGKGWHSKVGTCVEFYAGTIYRTKPKECKKLNIPWDVIDEKWKYAAMDDDGEFFLFEEKPTWKNNLWIDYLDEGEYIQLYNILKLDTTGIVAEHSLTKRPEGV